MPEDLHGWYCGHCCPACKAQAAEPPPAEATPPSEAAEVPQPAPDKETVIAPQAA